MAAARVPGEPGLWLAAGTKKPPDRGNLSAVSEVILIKEKTFFSVGNQQSYSLGGLPEKSAITAFASAR